MQPYLELAILIINARPSTQLFLSSNYIRGYFIYMLSWRPWIAYFTLNWWLIFFTLLCLSPVYGYPQATVILFCGCYNYSSLNLSKVWDIVTSSHSLLPIPIPHSCSTSLKVLSVVLLQYARDYQYYMMDFYCKLADRQYAALRSFFFPTSDKIFWKKKKDKSKGQFFNY